MNEKVEMKDEMMEQVNGGEVIIDPSQSEDYDNEIHPGCGGHILNHYNPFKFCVCDKCGETNYSFDDFYTRYSKQSDWDRMR